MNWWYPLPWDLQGHLELFVGGLFWTVIWYVLYLAYVGIPGVVRFLTRKSPEPSRSSESLASDAHQTTLDHP